MVRSSPERPAAARRVPKHLAFERRGPERPALELQVFARLVSAQPAFEPRAVERPAFAQRPAWSATLQRQTRPEIRQPSWWWSYALRFFKSRLQPTSLTTSDRRILHFVPDLRRRNPQRGAAFIAVHRRQAGFNARGCRCRPWFARFGQNWNDSRLSTLSKSHMCEQPDAQARLQHFGFLERNMIANVLVQQVVAGEADGDFARAAAGPAEGMRVAHLCLEQIVTVGRRLVERDVVLRERMQQADARIPLWIAPPHAAAEPHRRDTRHVGSVAKGCAHDVILAVDAEHAVAERPCVRYSPRAQDRSARTARQHLSACAWIRRCRRDRRESRRTVRWARVERTGRCRATDGRRARSASTIRGDELNEMLTFGLILNLALREYLAIWRCSNKLPPRSRLIDFF